MSEPRPVVHNTSIGITGLLFVAFVVLQVTGQIDWAWYWIASPLWIPLAVALGLTILFFAIAFPIIWVVELIGKHRRAKRRAERHAAL